MYYPINLEIEGQVCVVIGGGHVALRKVEGLLNAGAKIIVIAPEICEGLHQLVNNNKITWRREKYTVGCLSESMLVVAATNDKVVNSAVATEAAEKNILINLTGDIPEDKRIKRFNVPSIIRRDNLMLTVSTNGLSPALSKFIRKYLEEQFNENFARWLERLSEIRDEVKNKIKNANEREKFWRNVMSNENFSLAQNGEFEKMEANIRNALNGYRNKSQNFTD